MSGRRRGPYPLDVSRHVERLGGGDLPDYALQALAAIDAVHTDGGLPILRIDEVTIIGNTQARYEFRTSIIEVDPGRPSPHFAVAHEIGHAIDYMFGSGSFGSDPDLDVWRNAVYNTQGYERLLDQGNSATTLADAEFLEYSVRNAELWAISYAQYIAARSDDPTLLLALRERQGRESDAFQLQWEDEDFAAVADAIDEYFRVKSWKS